MNTIGTLMGSTKLAIIGIVGIDKQPPRQRASGLVVWIRIGGKIPERFVEGDAQSRRPAFFLEQQSRGVLAGEHRAPGPPAPAGSRPSVR